MNTCDLEETKHQALLKFEELCKEPEYWDQYWPSIYYPVPYFKRNNFKIVQTETFLSIYCGEICIFNIKLTTSKNKNNKYVKLVNNLSTGQECLRLQMAMKDPPPEEPKHDRSDNMWAIQVVESPSLWERIKTWMKTS